MGLISVIAYYNGAELGNCSYTTLEPVAYESARRFTFHNFQVVNKAEIDNSGHSFINVSIYLTNKFGTVIQLNKFKFVPLEGVEVVQNGNLEVYGHIVHDWFTDVYRQPLIDIFNVWDKGQDFKIPQENRDIWAGAYFAACGLYSGLPRILKKGLIIIDGKNVNDEYDFYLLIAKSLAGSMGFAGANYNSLVDSLIESYDKEHNKQIYLEFLNSQQIETALGKEYFTDILNLFEKNDINITLN